MDSPGQYESNGDFNSALKHADIIPLLKAVGLDTETLNSFRPVSHLVFGEIN